MDDFTFNESTHSGYYRGQRVPSVTEIIAPVGIDYSVINKDVLARAIAYGNNVHETIMLGMKGTLDYSTLDDVLKKVWEEFLGWFETDFPHIEDGQEIVKTRYYSKRLRYCGEPDIVLPDTIIEIKTRPYNEHLDCLQTSGYSGLPEKRDCQEIVVQLLPDYPLKPYYIKNKNRWSMFRKLLDHWHENNKMNGLIERWKRNG